MEKSAFLGASGIHGLKLDIGMGLFRGNAAFQDVLKPMTFDQLLNWKTLRFPKKEFALLREVCHTNQHEESLVKYDPIAFKMNRYSDIIPCKTKSDRSSRTHQSKAGE